MKKTLRIITIALTAILSAGTFSSCNMLGDIVENADDIGIDAKWTEEGNKLIYEVSVNYLLIKYKQVLTFEFDGDTCVKATGEFIFDSAQMAQTFYNELSEEEKANAKLDGKTIRMDLSEEYAELSKTELKKLIEESGGWEL